MSNVLSNIDDIVKYRLIRAFETFEEAKLLFENESIQHAGYILREGFVGHAYIKDNDGFGPFGDLESTHEVVGVTGACLAQRKEIWETIGKWNESFPSSYNDVDYCFRITEAGFSILQVNQAKLKHFRNRLGL